MVMMEVVAAAASTVTFRSYEKEDYYYCTINTFCFVYPANGREARNSTTYYLLGEVSFPIELLQTQEFQETGLISAILPYCCARKTYSS